MINPRQPYAPSGRANHLKQGGSVAVEFALIASFLFALLFGIMEFSRVLFYWNTATEATRLGARLAVVCDKDAAAIKTKMSTMLNILTSSDIIITYNTDPVTSNIVSVTVKIRDNMLVPTFIPFLPLPALYMPSFSTTLPRESMTSTITNLDKSISTNIDCS